MLVARAKQKPAVVRPLMLTGASAQRHASSSRFPAVHLLKPSWPRERPTSCSMRARSLVRDARHRGRRSGDLTRLREPTELLAACVETPDACMWVDGHGGDDYAIGLDRPAPRRVCAGLTLSAAG
jgi:hypothetical protein